MLKGLTIYVPKLHLWSLETSVERISPVLLLLTLGKNSLPAIAKHICSTSTSYNNKIDSNAIVLVKNIPECMYILTYLVVARIITRICTVNLLAYSSTKIPISNSFWDSLPKRKKLLYKTHLTITTKASIRDCVCSCNQLHYVRARTHLVVHSWRIRC